ncbi:MAG: terminase small subunit [Salinarimonas sp.]
MLTNVDLAPAARDLRKPQIAAAIRAGYSEKTARQQATRLLSNVHIENAIQAARSAVSERTAPCRGLGPVLALKNIQQNQCVPSRPASRHRHCFECQRTTSRVWRFEFDGGFLRSDPSPRMPCGSALVVNPQTNPHGEPRR